MKFEISRAAIQLVQRAGRVARLRAFDTKTEDGRSKERYRRAFLTSVSSGLVRLVNVIVGLIAVRLTLRYLGAERYGLWVAISSVMTMLSLTDLGINNGLVNGIANAYGRDDRQLARQYVSSAFFSLTAIALLLGAVFAFLYPHVPWASVFRLESPLAKAEVRPAICAFFGCLILSIPSGIAARVQVGMQQGFVSNLWSGIGALMGLGLLLLAIHVHGSLFILVCALGGGPVVAQICNGLFFFGIQQRQLRPTWMATKGPITGDLLRSGSAFLVLQIAAAVAFSSDNFILVRILGPEAVAHYAVPSKLFNVVAVSSGILVAPLWPAYGEALVRRDHPWIRRTLQRSVVASLAVSLLISVPLFFLAPWIIRFWIGRSFSAPSILLLAGLAAWSVLNSVSIALSTFLNSALFIKVQAKIGALGAIVNLAISIYLTRQIGLSGVVYGSIVAQTFAVLVPDFLYIRSYLAMRDVHEDRVSSAIR